MLNTATFFKGAKRKRVSGPGGAYVPVLWTPDSSAQQLYIS